MCVPFSSVSEPTLPTQPQPLINNKVPSDIFIQLASNNDDGVNQSEKGPLRTVGSVARKFSVPDSDTDSCSSESVVDESEPDQHGSNASLGTSAGSSELAQSPQLCSDSVGDELVGIEIETRGARCSVVIPKGALDTENRKEAGSSQNPMVIEDDGLQDESDDEGPEVLCTRAKPKSPPRVHNSPCEELSYEEDTKSQGSDYEIESCKSVMGAMSEAEASERSGLFAIYDHISDDEETDEEWEQNYRKAHKDEISRSLSKAYLQAEPAHVETDEGSDFSIMDDDDAHVDVSEDESLSGDETELEPMSTDEYPQEKSLKASAAPQVASLANTSSCEPLTVPSKPVTVLVEDSQGPTHVPGPSGKPSSVNSGTEGKKSSSGFLYVGEVPLNRAPSPSDAAMAKPAVTQANLLDGQTTPKWSSADQGMLFMSRHTRDVAFEQSAPKSDPSIFDDNPTLQKYPVPALQATSDKGYLDGPFASGSNYTVTPSSLSSAYGLNQLAPDQSSQLSTYTQANNFYPENFQYLPQQARAYNTMNAGSRGNTYWSNPQNTPIVGPSRNTSSINVYPRHGQIGARTFVPRRSLNPEFQQAYGNLPRACLTPGMSNDHQPTKAFSPAMKPCVWPGDPSLGQLPSQVPKGKDVDREVTRTAPIVPKGTARGVSINDIVDPSGPKEEKMSIAGSKRKADEISSTITEEQLCDSAQHFPTASTTEDAVLHDAQPRELVMPTSQISLPQSTSVESQLQTQPGSEEGHVSKKAKTATTSRSGFLKYAVTALASAVLGGVSVFATLVALPEDA